MNTKVTIITGAGVSVDSGLPTYRDKNGIWSDKNFEKMSHASCYGNYLNVLVPKWVAMSQAAADSEPNTFHHAVAEQKWDVITQNVDGLHHRAGSSTIELHGNFREWICKKCKKIFAFTSIVRNKINENDFSYSCPLCQSNKIRPDVVLFGEQVKKGKKSLSLAQRADVLVFAGTSALVYPVGGWIKYARKLVIVNPVIEEELMSINTETFQMTATEWVNQGMPLD